MGLSVIFKVVSKGIADELEAGSINQKTAVMDKSQVLDLSNFMNEVVTY